MHARPVALPARLLSPLAFLMRGAVEKSFRGDFRDIRAAAEDAAPSHA